jgi:hypothetical protein
MKSHRTRPTSCPWCHALIDGARPTEDDQPVPPVEGDASVCWYCARLSTFNDDQTLRKPTAEETTEFQQDPAIMEAIQVVRTQGPRDPGRRRGT